MTPYALGLKVNESEFGNDAEDKLVGGLTLDDIQAILILEGGVWEQFRHYAGAVQ